MRRLTAMGIPCGVLVAPVLPGLSDSEEQLTEVVEACAEAGAQSISGVALHLRGTVRGHYLDWLQGQRPDLVRLHRERFRPWRVPGGRGARAGRRDRAGGGTALRRDRPEPLPRARRPAQAPAGAGAARRADGGQQLRLL